MNTTAHTHNYYDVLGVDPSVDQTTIKKAYHRLAKVHHPDKSGGASVRSDFSSLEFSIIKEAYEVLSDPAKRHLYDEALAVDDCVNQTQFDYDFICRVEDESLRQVLDGFFFNLRDTNFKMPDTVVKVKVPLEDIYKRKRKRVSFRRLAGGTGGAGYESYKIRLEDQIIVFPREYQSDLVIEVVPLPHPVFECRDNVDLYYTQRIELEDTYHDYYFKLVHLDGAALYLKCEARSVYGGKSVHKIAGYGLPVYNGVTGKCDKGDLFIKFEIVYPPEKLEGGKQGLTEFEKKLAVTTTVAPGLNA